MARHEDSSKASIWTSRSQPFQEDMPFQLRDWRAERIGWWVMGILVVLACLGLFSNGPLSTTTSRDEAQRLSVEYERFYRFGASSDMRWMVAATPGTETTITVSPEFLEAFVLETITPEPLQMVATADGMQLVFAREEGAPLDIGLSMTPDEVGTVTTEIRLQGAEPVRLSTFIYP